MITEFAEIMVKAGMEEAFIRGVANSREAFLGAPGCHGFSLVRSVEAPDKFILMVQWESVAHHMELFRNAPAFQIWRDNVGHCFAASPHVWHGGEVLNHKEGRPGMSFAHYKIVPHDGGFAYTLDGVFSETFPSHEAALRAARRVAAEQRVPGESGQIEYQDANGTWHTEHVLGIDRPQADVEE